MSVKVAIVVGVVIVALFVGSLVVGAGQDDGSSADVDKNALVRRLGDAAGDPAAVKLDDVQRPCGGQDDPTVLVFTGQCTLIVRNDGDLRLLRMAAIDAIAVEAPAPEGDLRVEREVEAGEEVSVAVGEGETEIDLDCAGGAFAECRVRLEAA